MDLDYPLAHFSPFLSITMHIPLMTIDYRELNGLYSTRGEEQEQGEPFPLPTFMTSEASLYLTIMRF